MPKFDYYGSYCRICGDMMEDMKDKVKGVHASCKGDNFCTFCGKSVKGIKAWRFNGHYLTCSNECINIQADKIKELNHAPLKEMFPTLHRHEIEYLSEYEESDGEPDDYDKLIKSIQDGKIVILFDDSDGSCWFKTVPSMEVAEYVVESEDRKVLGMGCNQYIHGIISNKTSVKIGNCGQNFGEK